MAAKDSERQKAWKQHLESHLDFSLKSQQQAAERAGGMHASGDLTYREYSQQLSRSRNARRAYDRWAADAYRRGIRTSGAWPPGSGPTE